MSTNYAPEATTGSLERRLSRIEALTDNIVQEIEGEGFTHPPKVLADLRQAFQILRQAPQQLAAKTYPTGYLEIWDRVRRFRADVTTSMGADEADRYLSELFNSFQRKPGRPAEIPLATVMEAKRLCDGGKSYAEAGISLGLGRQQVRSALRHHYPKRNSGNSPTEKKPLY